MADADIAKNFEGGYNAFWKMGLFFAAVAAIYPKLAFIRRDVCISAEWKDIRTDVIAFFKERRYELESEEGDSATFRLRNMTGRIAKMYEDRLTLRKGPLGYTLEGLRKDALHIATALEHRFATPSEE